MPKYIKYHDIEATVEVAQRVGFNPQCNKCRTDSPDTGDTSAENGQETDLSSDIRTDRDGLPDIIGCSQIALIPSDSTGSFEHLAGNSEIQYEYAVNEFSNPANSNITGRHYTKPVRSNNLQFKGFIVTEDCKSNADLAARIYSKAYAAAYDLTKGNAVLGVVDDAATRQIPFQSIEGTIAVLDDTDYYFSVAYSATADAVKQAYKDVFPTEYQEGFDAALIKATVLANVGLVDEQQVLSEAIRVSKYTQVNANDALELALTIAGIEAFLTIFDADLDRLAIPSVPESNTTQTIENGSPGDFFEDGIDDSDQSTTDFTSLYPETRPFKGKKFVEKPDIRAWVLGQYPVSPGTDMFAAGWLFFIQAHGNLLILDRTIRYKTRI